MFVYPNLSVHFDGDEVDSIWAKGKSVGRDRGQAPGPRQDHEPCDYYADRHEQPGAANHEVASARQIDPQAGRQGGWSVARDGNRGGNKNLGSANWLLDCDARAPRGA